MVKTTAGFIRKYKKMFADIMDLPTTKIDINFDDDEADIECLDQFEVDHDFSVSVKELDEEDRHYNWCNAGNSLGSFDLVELYGCCGTAIMTNVEPSGTTDEVAHKIYVALQKMAEDIAANAGYTTIMCSDIEDVRRDSLDECGWEKLQEFVNKRTGNTVYICSKKLRG